LDYKGGEKVEYEDDPRYKTDEEQLIGRGYKKLCNEGIT
jgi:hypothetical protein